MLLLDSLKPEFIVMNNQLNIQSLIESVINYKFMFINHYSTVSMNISSHCFTNM